MRGNHLSGSIWNSPVRSRAQIVRRVCEGLEAEYGQPRLGNPRDVLDDLIYVMISNKTSPKLALLVYGRLKNAFTEWDDVLVSSRSRLRNILRPAGLANVKSQQIYSTLRRIAGDFGSCDLRALHAMHADSVADYLKSLPGVSDKVAKCVMMFTLGMDVLPVDSHVHRIATRLGWTSRNRADQCHRELEELIPPSRRYAFHVDCITHGRLVCRPSDPSCAICPIARHCVYNRNRS